MAIDPSSKYASQIDTSDPTGYPWGQARNVDTPGDGTGTPLEKAWLSDLWGLLQSLLSAAGYTPTGVPDKVGASQYFNAFKEFWDGDIFLKVVPYQIIGAPERGSFAVTTQETTPGAVAFSSDGTKMYIVGNTNQTVYQYTLSTAWDLSTASYASKSKDVSPQDTVPNGLAFSSDGTKMYIAGASSDSIYQYTLSTAWDVSTAGSPVGRSVTSEDSAPMGVAFKSDGTKMYVLGNANNGVFQYTLSTAWDLASESYDSVSLDVSSQTVEPRDLTFNADGSRLFVTGINNKEVYEYELRTPWDLSTAVYTGNVMAAGGIVGPTGIEFGGAGKRLYLAAIDGSAAYVHEFYSSRVVSAQVT
jgi:sugar lactone lactonase YvrE